ncbi:uncharacterized protein G2W53_007663 [Senna tora]|uniref:Uncharacterized protein n=1 Tax=Senna tora TaxID=362788 RepID=A0A834X6J9_9FABA|nr:uncharacterized protein G2W53_007663 [Senna tora]
MRSSQRINARARSADEDYCGCVSKLEEGESSPVTTGVRASDLGSGEVVNGNFGLVMSQSIAWPGKDAALELVVAFYVRRRHRRLGERSVFFEPTEAAVVVSLFSLPALPTKAYSVAKIVDADVEEKAQKGAEEETQLPSIHN